MADTQADVSIIKANAISKENHINTDEQIELKGITKDSAFSLGIIYVQLKFENKSIKHKFHVVPNHFPIPSDGIIGKDFIQKYYCKLDYYDMTFTVRIGNIEILIPIHFGNDWDEIAIPPRCEAFKFFKINNFNNTAFIEHQELLPGIFIANTIVHNENPIIRVINTTDSTAIIKNNLDITSEISEYEIFEIDRTNNPIERTKQLKEIFSKIHHMKR